MTRTFKPIYNEDGEFVGLHITETMTREEAYERGLSVVGCPTGFSPTASASGAGALRMTNEEKQKRSEMRKRRRRQGPLPHGRPKAITVCPKGCGFRGGAREMRAHVGLCPRKDDW